MKTILLPFLVLLLSVQLSNAQWVQSGLGGKTVNALAYMGNNLFAGASTFSNPFGTYISTDNGLNWTQTGLNTGTVISLIVNGNNIFAGTLDYGVFISTNNGTNWIQTSLNNTNVSSLVLSGNNIFAGTLNGIYVSSNNGTGWIQTSLNNRDVRSLTVNGNNVFAGTYATPIPYGVYLSTNNGTSWSQTTLNDKAVESMAINSNNIFAGTRDSGVYLSTNNGTSWSQTTLNNLYVNVLVINGNSIFAGTSPSGFYVSYNNGISWSQKNEGLGSNSVRSICILNNYMFAGTYTGGVFKRPLSELIGIQPISSEVPSQFSLSQNYPNPFNPSTIIRFNIKDSRLTTLKMFDILGRKITTLVNEKLSPGTYEVEWNASNYSSGVYYYKLVSGDYTDTKKMVLVK